MLERIARDKISSFIETFVNYDHKSFIPFDPDWKGLPGTHPLRFNVRDKEKSFTNIVDRYMKHAAMISAKEDLKVNFGQKSKKKF
jgi:hypothetical protein